ncbi:MAG: peptide chain release factor 3 [Candidatus Hydrogenedentota bacterium]|nr:MAG: peptide chain release factor 3 [Candidatus Hydrogenedentota bacterium]
MKEEIAKRRSFAMIAHPDAGKTTLTEKFLLYGGAIQLAGHVRAKKERRTTKSDWMKLEQDRGISINTSAMQFEYKDHVLNLLDTPGHEDFSEDTYRTLMAVECAIMLIDAAKGVEPQTIKLFKICREKKIPIITFINKMDLPALSPFELMDNIESTLGITCTPMVWPIGSGTQFRGLYDLNKQKLYEYEKTTAGAFKAPQKIASLEDPIFQELMGERDYKQLLEDLDLAKEMLPDFDKELFLACELTPVFFGSAVHNFGVDLLMDAFLELAPPPQPVTTSNGRVIHPEDTEFTAFIFKLQANMNKAHRDRVAFARITSGIFNRGMQVKLKRTGKTVKLSSPVSFFGQERSTLDKAYPGDIIGLINPGLYRIGDILYTGEAPEYHPLPRFAPEAFVRLIPTDTNKLKAFKKGVQELAEEGVVQLFELDKQYPVLGGVGTLQFDVFRFRLEDEYGAPCRLEPLPYESSRWIRPEDKEKLSRFVKTFSDDRGNPVILFESQYRLKLFQEENPEIPLFEHPIE